MTTFLNVKNRASSTLASGISDTDTSLTVATGEGSKFPNSNFHITIEDEILLCTSRSDDTFTIERAKEETVAASHSAGAKVELRITAKIISDLNAAINEKLDIADVDTDSTLAANSDSKVASQKATKTYVDTKDAANVKITGDQTVAGVKTFSSIPVLPSSNPTNDNQAARKKYVDDQNAAQVVVNQVVSGNLRNTNSGSNGNNYTEYTKVLEIRVNEALSAARITFDIYGGDSTTAYGRIYKNGVAIGTEQTQGNALATKSEDFTNLNCVANDLIQLYFKAVNGGSGQQGVSNLKLYYDQQIINLGGKTLLTPLTLVGGISTTNTL